VKTDELDELARANVLRSDRAVKIPTFVSNGGSLLWPGRTLRSAATSAQATRDVCFTSTAAVRYAIEFDADALNEILRMANAIGNAAAQSSAMTQNARGPSAP
jgi:hypothetical protein